MNTKEKQMVNILIDLKENHNVVGVKAEFEAEGTRMEEALRLKEVVSKAGLDLTIKVGGCEALRDLYEVRTIGVEAVVAPMIESPYALKKYIKALNSVFSDSEKEDLSVLINIETITGFNNAEEILDTPEAAFLDGVVLGRADMTGSMGMSKENANSNMIFEIAKDLALISYNNDKKFIIGGGVCPQSIPFMKRLNSNHLNKFETRKIIFDAQKALAKEDCNLGILKALDFELMWLKNKCDFYGIIYNQDSQRIKMLENYKQGLVFN